MLIRRAADRDTARKPLTASGTFVPESRRTKALPSRWSRRFAGEKWGTCCVWRSPTTRSARPSRIGRTSAGIALPGY